MDITTKLKKATVSLYFKNKIDRLGTAFFIDKEGLLLTAHHVVGDDKEFSIFYNNRWIDANLLDSGESLQIDMALLKINSPHEVFDFIPITNYSFNPFQENFISFGFPFDQDYEVKYPKGLMLSGVIFPPSIFDWKGYKGNYYTLDPSQMIIKGMSGAPVINSESNLIAIICAIPSDELKGYIGKALDIRSIFEICPSLQSRVKTVSDCRVTMIHHYSLPTIWASRDKELKNIYSEIVEKNNFVISVIAIGGTGKTALMGHLINDISDSKHFDEIVWFSFYYKESNFDVFLTETCKIFDPDFSIAENKSIYSKILHCFKLASKKSCLFIFDGIEIVMEDDPQSPLYGTFKDKALRDFFYGVCEQGYCKVVVTSRISLNDLSNNKKYKELHLEDISHEAAITFLRNYGLYKEHYFEIIFSNYGFHILTLTILASYIKEFYNSDASAIKYLLPIPIEDSQAQKLNNILESYWEKITDDELNLLNRLSSFRGNIDEDALHFLYRGKEKEIFFKVMLSKLMKRSLIFKEIREDICSYNLHPLIRNFFYSKIRDNEKNRIHIELMEYYKELIEKVKKDSHIIEASYHSMSAGLYEYSYHLLFDSKIDRKLFWLAQYSTLLEILEPIFKGFSQSNLTEIATINRRLAMAVDKNGNPEEAVKHFSNLIDIQKRRNDYYGILIGYLYLSEPLGCLGRFKEAIAAVEKANQIYKKNKNAIIKVKEADDEPTKDKILGRFSLYHLAIGEIDLALKEIDRAISVYSKRKAKNPVYGCWWNLIKAKIYIRLCRYNNSLKFLEIGLSIAKNNEIRDFEGDILCSLGEVHILMSKYYEAKDFIRQSLFIAHETGYKYLLCESLITDSKLSETVGLYENAKNLIDKALSYAKESNFRVHLINCYLFYYRFYNQLNDFDNAKKCIEIAQELNDYVNYYWAIEEINKYKNNIGVDS